MSTKSNRSSGTQHNSRGVTQGNTLVGPKSGLPIDEIVDGAGVRRLAVDSVVNVTLPPNLGVELDGVAPDGDSVHIVDNITGNKMKFNVDGSIDSNVEIDAADGDNIAIKDSDGDELDIQPDGSINVNVNPATTPLIANSVAILVNTEYSYAFPANTKRFNVRARGNAKLQIAFTSGQSGSLFKTIFPGSIYEEIDVKLTGITIYFQSNKAGETIEITSWT
jgi:hypothetical protein